MIFAIQTSIMRNQKLFQINNKHFNRKFIVINTINKLTALFLFDDFDSVTDLAILVYDFRDPDL
jgi:hypothetical protein